MKRIVPYAILLLVVCVGLYLRFVGLNWDTNSHLHPDERFLTMVGTASRVPPTFQAYMDPQTSTLNPANNNFQFFVYGLFPVTLNKMIAVQMENDSYDKFALQGRALSGILDLLTILLIFKTVRLLEVRWKVNKNIKFWASFLYAIAVLPIQLSHFFAVDTFLNFFMVASLYATLHFFAEPKKKPFVYILVSAVCCGLAIASKLTGIFLLPLLFMLLGGHYLLEKKTVQSLLRTALFGLLFGIVLFLTVRIASPYYFAGNTILDPRISSLFINNLKTLASYEGKDIWFPPAIQWISKTPVLFTIKNVVFFGFGIIPSIFLAIGIVGALYHLSRRTFKKKDPYFSNRHFYFLGIVLTGWILALFLYQSSRFVQSMRYFLFFYPFFCVYAAFGIVYVLQKAKALSFITTGLLVVLLFLWPVAFVHIYFQEHSRITASKWIYKNIENNSLILGEYWDDGLPLSVTETYDKVFRTDQLHVFDQDTEEKWTAMRALLSRADYYALSSNRGWGSIGSVPQKYPLMSKFYTDLLAGKTDYRKVKEFTSYPQICIPYTSLCLNFPDDWSEEAFTVYDHPHVIIFKNTKK